MVKEKRFKSIKDLLNTKTKKLIASGIVLGLSALCLMLLLYKSNNDGKIVKSDVQVIAEYMDIYDIQDVLIQDELTSYIESGSSGFYHINGRSFVVLATSGKTSSDIEYTLESSVDGKLNVVYSTYGNDDGQLLQRYKIIEVNGTENDVNIIKKDLPVDNEHLSGYIAAIIFGSNDQKTCYSIVQQQIMDIDLNGIPTGLYAIQLRDSKVYTYQKMETREVADVTLKHVAGRNYVMTLPTGDQLSVSADNLNIKENEKYNVSLSYSQGEFRISLLEDTQTSQSSSSNNEVNSGKVGDFNE